MIRFKILVISLLICLVGCQGEDKSQDIFNQAEKYFASGQVNEARIHYERYIEQSEENEPKRWQAWHRLTTIRGDISGDLEGAVEILKNMRLEFGDDPDRLWKINNRLANKYKRMGELEESYRIWKANLKSASQKEQELKGIINLAEIQLTQRNLPSAKEYLQKVQECKSGTYPDICSNIYYLWGKILYLEDQPEKAYEKLKKAHHGNARDELRARAGMLMADVLLKMGNESKAREYLKATQKLHPNPEAVQVRLNQLE